MMTTHTYTEEDCRFALSVEERKCCVTYSEMSTFKDDRQDYPNKEMLTSKVRPEDTDDRNNAILLFTPNELNCFHRNHPKLCKLK